MSKDKQRRRVDHSGEMPRSALLGRFGILLILLSGVFFFTMLAVPWFRLSTAQKGLTAGALFVGVQVSWWVGAAMVGPAAINAIRDRFRRS